MAINGADTLKRDLLKQIEKCSKYYEKDSSYLTQVFDRIIALGDGELCYEIACRYGQWLSPERLKACEKVVCSEEIPTYAPEFALNVRGSDRKALMQAVIDSKAWWVCLKYAEIVPDADVLALEQVILDSKSLYACYAFGAKVINKGADYKALLKAFEGNTSPEAEKYKNLLKNLWPNSSAKWYNDIDLDLNRLAQAKEEAEKANSATNEEMGK